MFGPECRVRGEIASSVFLGYANKAHDGFVGHSVRRPLGQPRRRHDDVEPEEHLWTRSAWRCAGERIETGRLNLGTLFGDHAKTAIGTMLATGTVVSAGANVFGAPTPPKYVPPFAWGCDGEERVTEEGFLRVAERVMARRDVELIARPSGVAAAHLRPEHRRMTTLFVLGSGSRRQLLRGGVGRGRRC